MYRARKGVGSYPLDITAWPSNIKAGWCATTGWCSAEDVKASQAYLNPDIAYPAGLRPVGGAPPAPANIIDPCAGKTGADYYACTATMPNTMVAEEELRQQARNQTYFEDIAGVFNPQDGGFNWWIAAAAGLGVFAIFTLAQPGPRRYGR